MYNNTADTYLILKKLVRTVVVMMPFFSAKCIILKTEQKIPFDLLFAFDL